MVLALVRFEGRAKGDHMSDDESIFLTPEEVAKRWKCHPNTVRKYCQEGMLKAHYIAGSWKIPTYALKEYEARVCNIK